MGGGFDVDNNWEILTARSLRGPQRDARSYLRRYLPRRTLEALAANGFDREHPACRRAIDYLVRTQLADGSWYGRWGVAYIYGKSVSRPARPARDERGRSRALDSARE